MQLGIGIGQMAERTQGEKGAFDVFHPGLHASFQLKFSWRTGIDLETVAFSTLRIGPLNDRITGAGAGDGTLGVDDD